MPGQRRLDGALGGFQVAHFADENHVWVVTQDERLLRLALDNGGQTGSLSLPTVSLSPTVGFGTLWMLVELGSGQIWRVDPTSVTPSGSTSFKGFPIEVKSGEGALWVANAAGTVQRVDPGGPDVVASIRRGLSLLLLGRGSAAHGFRGE